MSDLTIKHTVQIINKNGEEIISASSSKAIPNYDDFEKLGFRAAFHELEGAILETGKEANTQVAENYLSKGSKKKSPMPKSGSTPKALKR
jgi:hypothetical protein